MFIGFDRGIRGALGGIRGVLGSTFLKLKEVKAVTP